MLRKPIMYMERSDFTADGNVVPALRATPIFVMIQSDYCGHCTTAKPAFQRLAEEGIVLCMTIRGDGPDRNLAALLPKIYPGFQGYPSYILFVGGQKIPYTGARDTASMRNFVSEFV